MFDPVDSLLTKLSRQTLMAVCFVALSVVGIADVITGYEISFSVFYLVPVCLATWYAGKDAGLFFSFTSGLVWIIADLWVGHIYHYPLVVVWNAFVRLSFFIIVTLLLGVLRDRLDAEKQLARIDLLTGLCNRRAFVEQLTYDLGLTGRSGASLTLVYVDIDDFKRINDAHGHEVGDRVLRGVGQILIKGTRQTDTIARLGGDEFALLLPGTDLAGAMVLISKLRLALNEMKIANVGKLTCSVGAVEICDGVLTPEHAVAEADRLMYGAKTRGKDAVVTRLFPPSVREVVATGS